MIESAFADAQSIALIAQASHSPSIFLVVPLVICVRTRVLVGEGLQQGGASRCDAIVPLRLIHLVLEWGDGNFEADKRRKQQTRASQFLAVGTTAVSLFI